MKKLPKLLIILCMLCLPVSLIFAQDVKVKIDVSDLYSGYLPPIKAGNSYQFTIIVKNDSINPTCTVSLNKDLMGEVSSWVGIQPASLNISKGTSLNFVITITVPLSAQDRDYLMPLYFIVKDAQNNDHSFWGNTQTIIVDKSLPQTPSFLVNTTNKSVFVYSWQSFDERSNTYTNRNPSSGSFGIKSYTVVLKNPDGSIRSSRTKNAIDGSSHNFDTLSASTNYTVNLTATDVAGNTKSSEYFPATTTPNAPTGLSFSNTTYISTTLNWGEESGATGYDIYKYENSVNSKLNVTPVTGNSYTIIDLTPNTSHTFNIIALNSGGASHRSSNATVTTPALPLITGPSQICDYIGYSGATFTLPDLITGYAVSWSYSNNLTLISSAGATAVFKAAGSGPANINAIIISPLDQQIPLVQKAVWAGVPTNPTDIIFYPSSPCLNQLVIALVRPVSPAASGVVYEWGNTHQYIPQNPSATEVHFTTYPSFPYTTYVYVKGNNACGSSVEYSELLSVRSCGGGGLPPQPVSVISSSFIISPNPASSEITISQNENNILLSSEFDTPQSKLIKSVKIIDNYGMVQIFKTYKESIYSTVINISNLNSGAYLILINEGEDPESHNLIKN